MAMRDEANLSGRTDTVPYSYLTSEDESSEEEEYSSEEEEKYLEKEVKFWKKIFELKLMAVKIKLRENHPLLPLKKLFNIEAWLDRPTEDLVNTRDNLIVLYSVLTLNEKMECWKRYYDRKLEAKERKLKRREDRHLLLPPRKTLNIEARLKRPVRDLTKLRGNLIFVYYSLTIQEKVECCKRYGPKLRTRERELNLVGNDTWASPAMLLSIERRLKRCRIFLDVLQLNLEQQMMPIRDFLSSVKGALESRRYCQFLQLLEDYKTKRITFQALMDATEPLLKPNDISLSDFVRFLPYLSMEDFNIVEAKWCTEGEPLDRPKRQKLEAAFLDKLNLEDSVTPLVGPSVFGLLEHPIRFDPLPKFDRSKLRSSKTIFAQSSGGGDQ